MSFRERNERRRKTGVENPIRAKRAKRSSTSLFLTSSLYFSSTALLRIRHEQTSKTFFRNTSDWLWANPSEQYQFGTFRYDDTKCDKPANEPATYTIWLGSRALISDRGFWPRKPHIGIEVACFQGMQTKRYKCSRVSIFWRITHVQCVSKIFISLPLQMWTAAQVALLFWSSRYWIFLILHS